MILRRMLALIHSKKASYAPLLANRLSSPRSCLTAGQCASAVVSRAFNPRNVLRVNWCFPLCDSYENIYRVVLWMVVVSKRVNEMQKLHYRAKETVVRQYCIAEGKSVVIDSYRGDNLTCLLIIIVNPALMKMLTPRRWELACWGYFRQCEQAYS